MTDNGQIRTARKLIESLDAFRVLCRQLDNHAGALIVTLEEELRGNVHDTRPLTES